MLEHVDDFEPVAILQVFLADRLEVGDGLYRIGRPARDVQAQHDDGGYAGTSAGLAGPRSHFAAPLPLFAAPLPLFGEGLSVASALRSRRNSSFCLPIDASRTSFSPE